MGSQWLSLISMKISHTKGIFIVIGLLRLSMDALRKQDLAEFSWRNNVYNAKFSIKTRLEHGFAFEYMYVQWL